MRMGFWALLMGAAALLNAHAYAAGRAADVAAHWTSERRAQATPRDLVIDERGRGYLRLPNGQLSPYGHGIAGLNIDTRAKPPGEDTNPTKITDMDPADGDAIGDSYTFSANVADRDGIKSVSFVIEDPEDVARSFGPTLDGEDTWKLGLEGLTDGEWRWWVVVKDLGPRGGTTTTSPAVGFTVDTGGTPPDPEDTVADAEWIDGGLVQLYAGRLYFEMPANKVWNRWNGYVCSGTVAFDETTGRSVIITAAHCVYDDASKAFARNVLFIPDQADTLGDGTDLNCDNDPYGCWVPSFGVVDVEWTTRTFPDNIAWDYAYYVVSDEGAHVGDVEVDDALDALGGDGGGMIVSFEAPSVDDSDPGAGSMDFTYALGYSYSWDPQLRYSAEDMTTEGDVNWWLPSSELSGGSSGGPWVQPMDVEYGDGPIISVNSWGYTSGPGMAGPILYDTSAECVFSASKTTAFSGVIAADGLAGVAVTCD